MTIPILLVAGFLGAGKTTLVNHLLRDPGGRRIAAVVNDFGAVNIDAALLGMSGDGVIGLKNGCICCSLQGDLMRTLAILTRRRPAPDAIVIETSGTSDPAEIVRSLLDPVIYAVTPLDTVVTVVDARSLADRPALHDDALWRSQLVAADFVIVGKTDLVDAAALEGVHASLARWKPRKVTFDAVQGTVPSALLFSHGDHAPVLARAPRLSAAMDRFETMNWTAQAPLSLARFHAAVGRLSQRLLRAKGFVTFEHQAGRPMLFQLVGSRATIVPTALPAHKDVANRLVLIAEAGHLDPDNATALLDAATVPSRWPPPDAGVSAGRA